MTITLQDPTRQRDPSSRHAFPEVVGEPKLRAPRTLADELLARFNLTAPRTSRRRAPRAVPGRRSIRDLLRTESHGGKLGDRTSPAASI
jgi:hypothetical protein